METKEIESTLRQIGPIDECSFRYDESTKTYIVKIKNENGFVTGESSRLLDAMIYAMEEYRNLQDEPRT